MFTGIVDHCGAIKSIQRNENSLSAWITCNYSDLQKGESICVDGICLTVTDEQLGTFRCDISSETCRLTTAQNYRSGQAINIERSLRPTDRMGGHFVTGHIDQTASVVDKRIENDFIQFTFGGIDAALARKFLIKKGCVAVNGVSLTINEVLKDGFTVMLIPHTLERTNLKQLSIGNIVNIEFDWMVKIVAQQIDTIKQSLTV